MDARRKNGQKQSCPTADCPNWINRNQIKYFKP